LFNHQTSNNIPKTFETTHSILFLTVNTENLPKTIIVALHVPYFSPQLPGGVASSKHQLERVDDMENKALDNSEKILLLGILHYALAIFLIIIKIVPFNVLEYLQLTEPTYAILLFGSILMGSILYALSGPLQKKPQKDSS